MYFGIILRISKWSSTVVSVVGEIEERLVVVGLGEADLVVERDGTLATIELESRILDQTGLLFSSNLQINLSVLLDNACRLQLVICNLIQNLILKLIVFNEYHSVCGHKALF